jgi:hypothetical protein
MVCIAAGGLKGTAPWGTLRSKRLSPSNHELLSLKSPGLACSLFWQHLSVEEVAAAVGAKTFKSFICTENSIYSTFWGHVSQKNVHIIHILATPDSNLRHDSMLCLSVHS